MCHPLSALLPLSFFRSRILFALYTVHHRIGSLSTRDPPPSPLPYGPIVVFSPSLPTLFPVVTILPDAPPPQFSVSLEQRERVTIYSGDLRDRGSRPPCPRALTSLSLSPPHPGPLPNAVPSIGPVFDFSPHPTAVPTTLSSRSYTL